MLLTIYPPNTYGYTVFVPWYLKLLIEFSFKHESVLPHVSVFGLLYCCLPLYIWDVHQVWRHKWVFMVLTALTLFYHLLVNKTRRQTRHGHQYWCSRGHLILVTVVPTYNLSMVLAVIHAFLWPFVLLYSAGILDC